MGCSALLQSSKRAFFLGRNIKNCTTVYRFTGFCGNTVFFFLCDDLYLQGLRQLCCSLAGLLWFSHVCMPMKCSLVVLITHRESVLLCSPWNGEGFALSLFTCYILWLSLERLRLPSQERLSFHSFAVCTFNFAFDFSKKKKKIVGPQARSTAKS